MKHPSYRVVGTIQRDHVNHGLALATGLRVRHYGYLPVASSASRRLLSMSPHISSISDCSAISGGATANQFGSMRMISPLATAERWVNDRLRAAGRAGIAQATISRASVVEVPLKRTEGVRGVFTKDQTERYDGLIEISIRILGDDGREKASVMARAERSRTVAEDVSLIDREKVWFEMTEAMMNDLNASLQRQINKHLGAFVR